MGMLTIAETPVDAPEARLLMAKLSRTLARITGSDGRGRFHPEDVQEAGGTFLVAYLDGAPWGCGVLRRLSADTGEIKQIYARPNRAGGQRDPRRPGGKGCCSEKRLRASCGG